MSRQYRFRVRRNPTANSALSQPYKTNPINHPLHFCLTLFTFGLWGVVWWKLILTSRGEKGFISALDDDYWSYLIEREQPPAALYPLKVSAKEPPQQVFEA